MKFCSKSKFSRFKIVPTLIVGKIFSVLSSADSGLSLPSVYAFINPAKIILWPFTWNSNSLFFPAAIL